MNHLLRTGKIVRCIPMEMSIYMLRPILSLSPPIRYTPSELKELTLDYFLWKYTPKVGDLILDIGAGMGTEIPTYSELVGDEGKIIGFEPHRKSASIARRLIATNGYSNACIYELGLSNHDGELLISDDPNSLGINSTIREDLLSGPTISARSTTLDNFVKSQKIDKINFLKMNIEGAEIVALQGGFESLKITKNVAISCHDFVANYEGGGDEMRTKEIVKSLLIESGFQIYERSNDHRPVIKDMIYGARE